MLIEVERTFLDHDRHPLWADCFCLYAYLHPELDQLLYVGKADYSTVRERLHGDHKADLFDDIYRRYAWDQKGHLGDLLRMAGSRQCASWWQAFRCLKLPLRDTTKSDMGGSDAGYRLPAAEVARSISPTTKSALRRARRR